MVEAIMNKNLDAKVDQKAHADQIHVLQQVWNPLFHQIFKVKITPISAGGTRY